MRGEKPNKFDSQMKGKKYTIYSIITALLEEVK